MRNKKFFSAVAAVTLAGCVTTTVLTQSPPAEAAPSKQISVLVQGTSGSNDPTQATLAFVGAFGVAEAGHDVKLVLAGEAAYLINPKVADATIGVGLGSVSEWFERLEKHQVPVYVCGACSKARDLSEAELEAHGAQLITAKDFGDMVVAADRVVSY